MTKSKIDWCDYTWNPVWGCVTGCEYCYARKIARRFARVIAEKEGDPKLEGYIKRFLPVFLESSFNKKFPRCPCKIFVNSMSDIMWWEFNWMQRVLDRIEEYPQHIFMFLTKFREPYKRFSFPENCWLGVTITMGTEIDREYYARMFFFDDVPNIRFISFEPLLGRIPIGWLDKAMAVDWIIIGAQTNPYKPPKKEWVESIVEQADRFNIPVFMKNNLQKVWDDELIQEWPICC